MRYRNLHIAFLLCLLGALDLRAQDIPLFDQSARSMGAAGAYRSIVDDETAFSLNPAGIARNGEARSLHYSHLFFDGVSDWALSASLIDSKTEYPLHWGFQFHTVQTDAIKRYRYSLATGFSYADLLYIGLSNHLINFDRGTVSPEKLAFALDVGVLVFIGDYLAVGGTLYNAFRSFKNQNVNPVRIAGGTSFNHRYFRLAFDIERNLSANGKNTLLFQGGGEVILEGRGIWRAGYFSDRKAENSGYTLGLSVFLIDKSTLDISFVDQRKTNIYNFSAGLTIVF